VLREIVTDARRSWSPNVDRHGRIAGESSSIAQVSVGDLALAERKSARCLILLTLLLTQHYFS
jgi:hypothetical protein